jgi:protein SDA1
MTQVDYFRFTQVSFKECTEFAKSLFDTEQVTLVFMQVLEPVLKTLVNNFVTERNSADVIAIG